MLKVGDTAPDVELKDQDGQVHTLDTLLADGDGIVYFYPADFTPVCTAQACAFRDNFDGVAALGANIVGVSPQSESSHKKFADHFQLPFPLLSDVRKTMIKAYDVNGPMGFGVRRATFLIGTDRIVKKRVVADFTAATHLEILKATRS